MSFVLVKFESNWADEMQVKGFVVMESEKWEETKSEIKQHGEMSLCIGTNEEIPFNSGNEMLKDIRVTNLTDTEAAMYQKHFGDSWRPDVLTEFGHAGFIEGHDA